jgi:acyl carrier protein
MHHAPHDSSYLGGATAQAATTATEDLLTRLLQAALPDAQINLDRHLVEVGGDSLIAMGLMARLSEIFEIELSPILPFEADSLRDLATRIDMVRQSVQVASAT